MDWVHDILRKAVGKTPNTMSSCFLSILHVLPSESFLLVKKLPLSHHPSDSCLTLRVIEGKSKVLKWVAFCSCWKWEQERDQFHKKKKKNFKHCKIHCICQACQVHCTWGYYKIFHVKEIEEKGVVFFSLISNTWLSHSSKPYIIVLAPKCLPIYPLFPSPIDATPGLVSSILCQDFYSSHLNGLPTSLPVSLQTIFLPVATLHFLKI